MPGSASDLARRLADVAEDVCRRYLSAGRREGRYWMVGDVANTPGRSLYVRLRGSASAQAGKWRDAATGERGDLLDLIAAREGLHDLKDVLGEARWFLSLPRLDRPIPDGPAPSGSPEAARRLFAASRPLRGTLAEAYLEERRLVGPWSRSLRFHPRCFYRPREGEPSSRPAWPALIAAVTDFDGTVTGVQRTWLDPRGGKAPVAAQRRALGDLIGHGVRFGATRDVMAVGEGLETVLSLRVGLATIPMVAAGSAAHLEALILPPGLRRLYVAEDADAAGRRATATVIARAAASGIEALPLRPVLDDHNTDLRRLGLAEVRARLRGQLAPEDVQRFWAAGAREGGGGE